MASIWAGRTAKAAGRALRIVGLDGATRLGAKILVAGGGRCNVTHEAVTERDYAGSTPPAIRNVLRGFGVERTVEFFRGLGVELKREETGKLFPVTDRARTVLDALLGASAEAGVELRHPARVERIVAAEGGGFEVAGPWGVIHAARVVLAAGGMALPRTGSDGFGYVLARVLGHTITPRVFPALVPLRLEAGHVLTGLAGVSAPARVEVRSGSGRRIESFTGPVLMAHFGLTGPAVMNMSRHLTAARDADPAAGLTLCWLPDRSEDEVERAILEGGATRAGRIVDVLARGALPARLVEALCTSAGCGEAPCAAITREQRRSLVGTLCAMPTPVVGDRGFTFAEATAGGVPLREIRLGTMESRVCPGLHLCGEILDVDGRIGGFNFQWAWASGHAAGVGAVSALPPGAR